jgi:hypothetical protein
MENELEAKMISREQVYIMAFQFFDAIGAAYKNGSSTRTRALLRSEFRTPYGTYICKKKGRCGFKFELKED